VAENMLLYITVWLNCCFSECNIYLLLACYVPNVAKACIYDQCNIEDQPTDQRPASVLGRAFLVKTLNGHISITVLDRRMVTVDHR